MPPVAKLNVNPADLQRVAGDYAEIQAHAAAVGPQTVEEVRRIIATHGPMGYPVALGVATGLARRQAALDAQAARFGEHSQRFTEHAATYATEDRDAAHRYNCPADLLDTAAAEAPYLTPPTGYIIWCTPADLVSGFICEFMGEDGGITWRHSPIDITGGMP
jgi:Excreted virulence factor EspC, type VII ESX diderm